MNEIKVLSPTAILGYGFPMSSFNEGMKRNPDVIAVDAGSTSAASKQTRMVVVETVAEEAIAGAAAYTSCT